MSSVGGAMEGGKDSSSTTLDSKLESLPKEELIRYVKKQAQQISKLKHQKQSNPNAQLESNNQGEFVSNIKSLST